MIHGQAMFTVLWKHDYFCEIWDCIIFVCIRYEFDLICDKHPIEAFHINMHVTFHSFCNLTVKIQKVSICQSILLRRYLETCERACHTTHLKISHFNFFPDAFILKSCQCTLKKNIYIADIKALWKKLFRFWSK